jgi:hypothetical protein
MNRYFDIPAGTQEKAICGLLKLSLISKQDPSSKRIFLKSK